MVEVEGDGQTSFVVRLIKEANWKNEVDSNVMWNKMVDYIRHVAKEEQKNLLQKLRQEYRYREFLEI